MKRLVRKDKNEKRRLQFEKQKRKYLERVERYGTNSMAEIAVAETKRMILKAAAILLVVSLVLGTTVFGFSVFTRAEEYEEEDKPITMQVMVNDKALMDSNEEPFTVQFPSALISKGLIKDGIDYQKVDDNQEIVVDSIFNKVVNQIFNNDLEIIEEFKDRINFLGSYVITSEQEKIQITNLIISDDEIVQYLPEDNEITETSLGWINAKEGDAFILSFEDNSGEPIVIEGSSKNLIIAEPEDAISVEPDGTIQEINGKMPAMVKGLFRGPALANSGLNPVDVFHVIYNDVPLDDINITLPAGDIEDNMSDPSVDEQEHNLLHPKAVWKDAVIWKWNSDSNSYTEYQIANVGKSGDEIYYSFEGNNEDTGIKLEANDKLYLKYDLTFSVSYQFTPSDGGTLDGAIDSVKYGHSLPVSLHPNTYYSLTSTTYNIVTGYDSDGVTPNSYKYGSAQPVVNQTIPAEDIVGDVEVYASFAEDTSYYIDANGIEHGHVCAAHSMDYSNENNGDNIAEYGPTDPNSGIKHGITVEPGGTAYLVMFAQKANNASDTYSLNAIWLNGEEVKVPSTSTYVEGSSDNIAVTTLSNGSVVTVSLVADARDNHLRNNANTLRTRYIIKIEDVKENIDFDVYFRPYSESKVYLKGLRGIANTAAAYPVDTYSLWGGSTSAIPGDGNQVFYFFDENGTHKEIDHMYRALNLQLLDDEITGLSEDILFLGHQLKAYDTRTVVAITHRQQTDFHMHNVFLAKVKPGYNSNSIAYSDFLADYSASSGFEYLLDDDTTEIDRDSLASESSLRLAIDEKHSFETWGLFSGWTEIDPSHYCNWDDRLTASQIPDTILNGRGRYRIFTHESSSNSVSNNRAAVITYTPFIEGARDQRYYNGIAFRNIEHANNSFQINATAYKYKIQYLYDGQNEDGTIPVSNATINYDSEKYEEDNTAQAFKEKKRHAIEFARNNSSEAVDYESEFANVDGKTITLPDAFPTHENDDNYMYSFIGWKMVKYNPETNTYFDTPSKLFQPGESFSLDDKNGNDYYYVGSATVNGTGSNNGRYAQKAQYDVTSGEADRGYAWGDYTSPDENALTFTFMPIWRTTPIGGYLSYSVRAYKNTPDGALTDLEGNPRTVTKGEGDNAKVYYLYYENTDSKAAPGSEIVSLNQHYPTDGKRYDLNSSLSKEKINSLTTGQDDEIEYYYDVSEMDVTIDEETVAADTEAEGYLERGKEFDIVITLYKEDGTTPAEAKTYGNTPFVTENGKTTATIRMKDSDAPITIPIPYGYVLSVDETDSSRGWYADSYYDETNSYDDAYPSITIDDDITITVRNTVFAPIIEGIYDRDSSPIGIMIRVVFAVVAAAGIIYLVFLKRKLRIQ